MIDPKLNADKATAGLEGAQRITRRIFERSARKLSRHLLTAIRRLLKESKIAGLALSWQESVPTADSEGTIRVGAYSAHMLARLRDRGGLVLPGKTAPKAGPNKGKGVTQALTIPLDKTAQREVSRGTAALMGKLHMIPATRKGQRLWGAENICGLLVDASGAAKFILAFSVNIPPHPYIAAAVEDTKKYAANEMAVAMQSFVSEIRAGAH